MTIEPSALDAAVAKIEHVASGRTHVSWGTKVHRLEPGQRTACGREVPGLRSNFWNRRSAAIGYYENYPESRNSMCRLCLGGPRTNAKPPTVQMCIATIERPGEYRYVGRFGKVYQFAKRGSYAEGRPSSLEFTLKELRDAHRDGW